MKRVLSFLAVVALCVALTTPAYAAEFVHSITDKGLPEIVPVEDGDGKPAIAVIIDDEDEVIDYVDELCLVLTPVSEARTSTLIPDAAEETLLYVYEQLDNGSMQLPYDKVSANLNADNMVIRDLFDASWLCSDHPELVAQPNVYIRIVFDLGVAKNADVCVMTYKNNEWNPIKKVVNNGDGTVSCAFEDFCPIAIAVKSSPADNPPSTGDNPDYAVWILVMLVSAAALVTMVSLRKKVIG